MVYREESYIHDNFIEKEDDITQDKIPPQAKNAMKLVDKTHINDVFDTSTVVVAEGAPSPGKSAITRHRDSSCSD